MNVNNENVMDVIKDAKKNKLTKLNLVFEKNCEIPLEIFDLNFLTELKLTRISRIPPEICKLENLLSLEIHNSRISYYPKALSSLKSLHSLTLRHCSLSKIPSATFSIENLTSLILIENNISEIPIEITKLSKLEELNFSSNKLTQLPEYLEELKNLKVLWLYNNHINQIPDFVFEFKKLDTLSLQRNQIKVFPNKINNLKKLKILRLSDLRLTKIPKEVFDLKLLTHLYLSNNCISHLDNDIGNLVNLKILDLSENEITSIPEQIGHLSNLIELNIRKNKIERIPKTIGKLTQLKVLNLSHNKLLTLPIEISDLKNLSSNNLKNVIFKGLDIEGNLFQVPPEILEKNPQELISYIIDIQTANTKKPLHEAKLIFLGSGSVGKTSLINMLLTGDIGDPEKTNGIEIQEWKVNVKDKEIKLHIWDFGGQEIMHATHKFFMTRRSAYVLVVNSRIEDKYGESELEYWLKLIHSYAGEVPIVIVFNKCEQHFCDISKRELKDKYNNIVGFVETSCVKKIGITKLKKTIEKAVKSLKHIDSPLPKSYFDVKQALETANKDFIMYSDYENICKTVDSDFKDESIQTLVGLLHDLGIMLNFRNDNLVSLRETQVLNPRWVTQGVYQIITSENVIYRKGIIDINDVFKILDPQKYPTIKECHYIMDIMHNFELCYHIPDSVGKYFIPGAFPKDRPKIEWNFKENEKIIFLYKYEVLPNSIMSRFIVKVHPLIRGNDYWRNGVVIQKDGCYALIKADPPDRKISIEVAGGINKRDLLSFARGQFDLIHDNFKYINVKRYISITEDGKNALIDYDDLIFHENNKKDSIGIKELNKFINVKKILNGVEDEFMRNIKKEIFVDNTEKDNNLNFSVSKEFKSKILFLASNPSDTGRLRVDEEVREIEEGLIRSKNREKFELVSKFAVRISDLRRALLDEEPYIVHFSGHGTKGTGNLGGIVLEDNNGSAKIIASLVLGNLFDLFKDNVQCVFLNSCYSEHQAIEIVKHIPYVIGMNNSVNDLSAITFAISFYDALGAGRDIEFAFKFAKMAIESEGLSGSNIPIFLKK